MEGSRPSSTNDIFITHSIARSRKYAVPRGTAEPMPKTFSVRLAPALPVSTPDTQASAAESAPERQASAPALGSLASAPGSVSATCSPLAAAPQLLVVLRPVAAIAPAPPSYDATLIKILDAPLLTGETAAAGFHRKEVELGNAFGKLTVLESRALNVRLANPKPGDALAEKFSRLTSERRARLLTFLADARRREAIATARR